MSQSQHDEFRRATKANYRTAMMPVGQCFHRRFPVDEIAIENASAFWKLGELDLAINCIGSWCS